MTLEFVKAHTGKDGKHYTVGQLAEIEDVNIANDLVRQGIARSRTGQEKGKSGETPEGEQKE